MKIIYFGTPEFAVKPLENLYGDSEFEILAVVTQPNKPQGRKQILTASQVKDCAENLGIPVIQPKNKHTGWWPMPYSGAGRQWCGY